MDFFQNIFTRYGILASDTEAVTTVAPETEAVQVAPEVVGDEERSFPVIDFMEPSPSIPPLGSENQFIDNIQLRATKLPLFEGPPTSKQFLQEWLENCPLGAVLTAMTHVPKFRVYLQSQMIEESRVNIVSQRIKADFEFLDGNKDGKVIVEKVSYPENNRLFKVRFYSSSATSENGISESIVQISAAMLHDIERKELFYARSVEKNVLWPAIVEKAYVRFLGQNSYQSLNHGLDVGRVMMNLTGEEQVLLIEPSSSSELGVRIKKHEKRPTVVVSKIETHPQVVGNHVFAVVGYGNGKVNLVDALGEKDSERFISLTLAEIGDHFRAIVQGSTKPL